MLSLTRPQLSLAMRVEEKRLAQLEILKQQMALMGAPTVDDADEAEDHFDPNLDPEIRAKIKKEKEVF